MCWCFVLAMPQWCHYMGNHATAKHLVAVKKWTDAGQHWPGTSPLPSTCFGMHQLLIKGARDRGVILCNMLLFLFLGFESVPAKSWQRQKAAGRARGTGTRDGGPDRWSISWNTNVTGHSAIDATYQQFAAAATYFDHHPHYHPAHAACLDVRNTSHLLCPW